MLNWTLAAQPAEVTIGLCSGPHNAEAMQKIQVVLHSGSQCFFSHVPLSNFLTNDGALPPRLYPDLPLLDLWF